MRRIAQAWSGFCAHVEALDTRLAEFFKSLGGVHAVLEGLDLDARNLFAERARKPPINAALAGLNAIGRQLRALGRSALQSGTGPGGRPPTRCSGWRSGASWTGPSS